MKLKKSVRQGFSILLSVAMVMTVNSPWNNVQQVQAAGIGGNAANTPDVTKFATADQLKNSNNFSLYQTDSESTAVAQKVYFGTGSDNEAQTWYIAGDDGNGLVLLCDSDKPLMVGMYQPDISGAASVEGDYEFEVPTTVYANHYGSSQLRELLRSIASDTVFFTEGQQELMKDTTVYDVDYHTLRERYEAAYPELSEPELSELSINELLTEIGSCNEAVYATTDKLYAAYATQGAQGSDYIMVGTNDRISLGDGIKVGVGSAALSVGSSYTGTNAFWLRTANGLQGDSAYIVGASGTVSSAMVMECNSVVPAMDLDTTNLLFASVAEASKVSKGAEQRSEELTGETMTLRFAANSESAAQISSTAIYNEKTVKVTKDSTDGEIYLYVQGNDGTDWVYSQKIEESQEISASEIRSGADLTDCKIWLETTDETQNLTYAVMATEGKASLDQDSVEEDDEDLPSTGDDQSASDKESGSCSTDQKDSQVSGSDAENQETGEDSGNQADDTKKMTEDTLSFGKAVMKMGSDAEVNYSAKNKVVKVLAGSVELSGDATGYQIVIPEGVSEVTITLNDFKDLGAGDGKSTFDIAPGSSLSLILAEDTINTIVGGKAASAIYVRADSSLTIDGSGTLKASIDNGDSDVYSAVIGGNCDTNYGNITINGGVIYAESTSTAAAAIGAAKNETEEVAGNGTITLNGGEIHANTVGGVETSAYSTVTGSKAVVYTDAVNADTSGFSGSIKKLLILDQGSVTITADSYTMDDITVNYSGKYELRLAAGTSVTFADAKMTIQEDAVMDFSGNNKSVQIFSGSLELSGTADGYSIDTSKPDSTDTSEREAVTITLNGFSDSGAAAGRSPFYVAESCHLQLFLAKDTVNTLVGGFEGSAIRMNYGSALTVDGEGTLKASVKNGSAAAYCAVIGSQYTRGCGEITINGGVIYANSSSINRAAGIGTARYWNTEGTENGTITINGGEVHTNKIGGVTTAENFAIKGEGGVLYSLNINADTTDFHGTIAEPEISASFNWLSNTSCNATFYASYPDDTSTSVQVGSVSGCDISMGHEEDSVVYTASAEYNGTVYTGQKKETGKIYGDFLVYIDNSSNSSSVDYFYSYETLLEMYLSTGMEYEDAMMVAEMDSEMYSSSNSTTTTTVDYDDYCSYSDNTLTISNGTVYVWNVDESTATTDHMTFTGSDTTVVLGGVNIVTSSTSPITIDDSSGNNITIKLAGENYLESTGGYAAAIRKSNGQTGGSDCATLKITSYYGDGSFEGTLTAKASGIYSAGIGGQGQNGDVKGITISGGTINAVGNCSAGIGPSGFGSVWDFVVDGGYVTASSFGVYFWVSGSVSNVSITGGIVSGDSGKNYTVYGTDTTLQKDFTLSKDQNLSLSEAAVLAVSDGVALINDGLIKNNGTIKGSVTNKGEIRNYGTIDGTVDNSGTIHQNGTINPEPVGDGTVCAQELQVTSGTGSDVYEEGTEVTVTADKAPEGMAFSGWNVTMGTLSLTDEQKSQSTMTFTMPKSCVDIEATYKTILAEVTTADGETTSYTESYKATEDWKELEGATLKVLSDEMYLDLWRTSKNGVIDLNGYTVTAMEMMLSQDVTIKDGTLAIDMHCNIESGVTLSLKNVTIEGRDGHEMEIYNYGTIKDLGGFTLGDGITIKYVNYENLQIAITTAENLLSGDNTTGVTGYSDLSAKALEDAITDAKKIEQTAAETEITEAKEALETAQGNLKTATVTVKVASNPEDAGVLTGAGKYAAGETISLEAEAVSGYEFVGWYQDDTLLSEDTAYKVEVTSEMEESVSYIAKYRHVVTYKDLQTAISDAETVAADSADYSDLTVQALKDAITAAKKIKTSATETAFEDAIETLKTAQSNLKQAVVTVKLSSDPEGSSVLTGDGKYAAGETISLKAKAVSGYTFVGWYQDGELISEGTGYTTEVTTAMAGTLRYTAKYKLNEVKNKLTVDIGNGTVEYSYQDGAKNGTWKESVSAEAYSKGTYFTVKAVANEGYRFLCWVDESGRVLSETETYSFYLGEDVTIRACYSLIPTDTSVYVIFKDKSGKILTSEYVTIASDSDYGVVEVPERGNYVGYTFTGWQDEDGNEYTVEDGKVHVTKDVTITAVYEAITGLTVTVNGTVLDKTYSYGDTVTVTAEESQDNHYFSGWYSNEKLVSDSQTYTFCVTSDTVLTAMYQGEEVLKQQPMANFSLTDRTTLDTGKQTLQMVLSWSLPEGYTFVGAGTVRTLVDAQKGNLSLENVDGSSIKKTTTTLTSSSGAYRCTVTLSTASVSKNLYAVGYLTYKEDDTGEVKTIYTDVATSKAAN